MPCYEVREKWLTELPEMLPSELKQYFHWLIFYEDRLAAFLLVKQYSREELLKMTQSVEMTDKLIGLSCVDTLEKQASEILRQIGHHFFEALCREEQLNFLKKTDSIALFREELQYMEDFGRINMMPWLPRAHEDYSEYSDELVTLVVTKLRKLRANMEAKR